jgi:hypothetical protein
MNTDTELAADVEAAHRAQFAPEANKLQAVQSFFEIRGLHNRGQVGDCALRTAHRNAVRAAEGAQRPHTLDHFSAQDRAIGRRITHSFGHWLEKCESHDSWHELPEEQRKPTLANVAAFLDDYADFEPVKPPQYYAIIAEDREGPAHGVGMDEDEARANARIYGFGDSGILIEITADSYAKIQAGDPQAVVEVE